MGFRNSIKSRTALWGVVGAAALLPLGVGVSSAMADTSPAPASTAAASTAGAASGEKKAVAQDDSHVSKQVSVPANGSVEVTLKGSKEFPKLGKVGKASNGLQTPTFSTSGKGTPDDPQVVVITVTNPTGHDIAGSVGAGFSK
ncbi:hypothetical protein [Streptomyces sp. WAC06614]|uniref:hypothetical protein n=1 Tax=Streptomyces sp. WAC06614 TaxID=2487416 RepID=UPI000F78A5A5|nr:hypothetical protein [Streptomyces sp. WAC06614]RSS79759.1 hypothetical protein EF918_16200 [Streptomyces sp. WAC06614]